MAPMFAFIAVSSTIYQQTMQLGALQYGLLFAFNALSLMLGNLLYLKLQHKLGDKRIIVWAIAISLLGGVIQLLLSPLHGVLVFALPMFLITFGGRHGQSTVDKLCPSKN